jgi:hypothetical protein
MHMILKRASLAVPLSTTFLCISVLLNRLAGRSSWSGFFEGVFTGMALALSVFALIVGALARSHE